VRALPLCGAEALEAVEDQVERELELELVVAASADHSITREAHGWRRSARPVDTIMR
jgi:hypothetical protein